MNDDRHRLDDLRERGRMRWIAERHAWIAHPDEIVAALAHEGFQEYKREETRSRRDREPTGGVWQGLNAETGSVASAIWVNRTPGADPIVFIDIDGEPVVDPRGDA